MDHLKSYIVGTDVLSSFTSLLCMCVLYIRTVITQVLVFIKKQHIIIYCNKISKMTLEVQTLCNISSICFGW
jgi:hypothetical protein